MQIKNDRAERTADDHGIRGGNKCGHTIVKVRSQIDATNWKEAVSWFDGLGRNILSQSIQYLIRLVQKCEGMHT